MKQAESTNIGATAALPPGKHTIVYEFVPDGPKPGAGGKSTDGSKASPRAQAGLRQPNRSPAAGGGTVPDAFIGRQPTRTGGGGGRTVRGATNP